MQDDLTGIIQRVAAASRPEIEFIKRCASTGRRLGIFASSFNPPTIAHMELIRQAARSFSLDQTLALAGWTNADKIEYECSLADRLVMLRLAFAETPGVSIGLSSHPYYVDMVEALERVYPPQTDLNFIVGFDTFERVIDPEGSYTARYHRHFRDRGEALRYLLARSSFIVAARAGAGLERVAELKAREHLPPGSIAFLDFPPDLGEISATEVRRRLREGQPISELVPSSVVRYLTGHALYRT